MCTVNRMYYTKTVTEQYKRICRYNFFFFVTLEMYLSVVLGGTNQLEDNELEIDKVARKY